MARFRCEVEEKKTLIDSLDLAFEEDKVRGNIELKKEFEKHRMIIEGRKPKTWLKKQKEKRDEKKDDALQLFYV